MAGKVEDGAWQRLVRERVGEPLRPESLRSVFLIVPGSSGDVALATTVVRYIKSRNPECYVAFAVKRSNLSLLGMCPGVDEAIECPAETPATPRSRRRSLAEHARRADAVVYPICDPEDMDLLHRYNFLETIWLLAGVPDGLPDAPQSLWLVPPGDPEWPAATLLRSLSRERTSHLAAEAFRQPGRMIGRAVRRRTARNAGWKKVPAAFRNLLQNAAYIRSVSPQSDPSRFVIVSSEANMFPPPARGLFESIVDFLRSRGRVVLHNVLDPAGAAAGTVPLVCSYEEFLALRRSGIPFIGWRSGLCDIAAASPAPMVVLYPRSFDRSAPPIRDLARQHDLSQPTEIFGFASMKIAADCLELVCDGTADLDLQRLAVIL